MKLYLASFELIAQDYMSPAEKPRPTLRLVRAQDEDEVEQKLRAAYPDEDYGTTYTFRRLEITEEL